MQDRRASIQFSHLYAYRVGENLRPIELAGEGEGPPAGGADGAFLEAVCDLISIRLGLAVVFFCGTRSAVSCVARMAGWRAPPPRTAAIAAFRASWASSSTASTGIPRRIEPGLRFPVLGDVAACAYTASSSTLKQNPPCKRRN